MNILPKNSVLGRLTIDQVIEYYDFPRLFTCKTATGKYYIVLSVDEDEKWLHWLYVSISNDRLNSLFSKKLSLYQAFKTPEDEYLFYVKTDSEGLCDIEYKFSEQIPDNLLPIEDEYVQIKTNNYGLGEVNPQLAAFSSNRDTINIHITPNDTRLVELNARNFGSILISFQELIDAVGQRKTGNPTISGPIPRDILKDTRLNTCQIFEGSFGVQLKADQPSDMFHDSFLTETMKLFATLLSVKDSEELLKEILHDYKGRVASKYRRFLKELTKINTNLKVVWGSPKSNYGGDFSLTKSELLNTFKIVDYIDMELSEEIEVKCTLIGINVRTQSYEILSTEDNEKFSGKFSDEAHQEVAYATINNFYIAKLKKIIEVQSSSGQEKIKWLLTGLSENSANE